VARRFQASIYMTTWLIAALLVRPAPAIQAPASETVRKADSVMGEVTTLDLPSRKLTVQTETGTLVGIHCDEKTVFLKARPGSSTLSDATPARLEELAAGDRVLVSAVDPAKGEITLQARRPGGTPPIVIAAGGPGVRFRRYAADSVKFSDARPSALADVHVGDQLRALGERSEDGSRLAGGRGARGGDTELPPDLMDLGISIP
jgi:hypothetical protein